MLGVMLRATYNPIILIIQMLVRGGSTQLIGFRAFGLRRDWGLGFGGSGFGGLGFKVYVGFKVQGLVFKWRLGVWRLGFRQRFGLGVRV